MPLREKARCSKRRLSCPRAESSARGCSDRERNRAPAACPVFSPWSRAWAEVILSAFAPCWRIGNNRPSASARRVGAVNLTVGAPAGASSLGSTASASIGELGDFGGEVIERLGGHWAGGGIHERHQYSTCVSAYDQAT